MTSCRVGLLAGLFVSMSLISPVWAEPSAKTYSGDAPLPQKFTPMDTSRFMLDPDPVPLEKERAFTSLKFERPVEVVSAGDGTNRLFVVEQQGTIRVFDDREDVQESRLFLDLRDVVLREGNEEGLLGLAFHPNYKENGHFFVYYSTRPEKTIYALPPRASIVSRFTVSKDNPDQADRASEKQLLRIDQPFSNHNGGSICFGPDGYLYIGLGDGGAANDQFAHAQNLETLLGSILRIDVDRQDEGKAYAIPKDNPFVGRGDARGEIWAYGLRNTWRLSFDPETGQLWAGDVGQNRFEEVNLIVRGGNYGWNKREGFHNFEPQSPDRPIHLLEPLAEYFRHEGQSVTGGLVYRGDRLKEHQGDYFYADYVTGNVWALRYEDNQVIKNERVAETGLQIAAFGTDTKGEMLLCAFDGHLYRLKPRELDLEKRKKTFPRLLSETGLFRSVAENIPAEGMIPYELNMPFWSDYAVKDRYLVLPENGSIGYRDKEKWKFPVGTVFVKTFWMHTDRANLAEPVRLETRLLVHSLEGWKGYTYVYNDDQTEAELLEGSLLRPIRIKTDDGGYEQRYYFPTRQECMACHTPQEGFVLGLNTRQMNHTLNYHGQSENQIEMFTRLKLFEEPPGASADELETYQNWQFGNLDRSGQPDHVESSLETPGGDTADLARAWLDVNCATCHRPEGIAPGRRHMQYHASLDEMNMVGKEPLQGSMAPLDSAVIKPGAPFQSELLIRAAHRGERQMPPLSSNVTDPRGTEILRKWIEGLSKDE